MPEVCFQSRLLLARAHRLAVQRLRAMDGEISEATRDECTAKDRYQISNIGFDLGEQEKLPHIHQECANENGTQREQSDRNRAEVGALRRILVPPDSLGSLICHRSASSRVSCRLTQGYTVF